MRPDLQSHSPFGELMGTTIVSVDADRRTIETSYDLGLEATNRIGTIAGGMICAMLDSVTGLVALSILPTNQVIVHTSLQVEYLRPARPGRIRALGEVCERTDRDIHSRGELFAPDGTRLATAAATLRIIETQRAKSMQ